VDLDERRVLWRYEHPERKFPFYGSAAVGEDLVIIGGRDKLVHALDPDTGEVKWVWNSGARLDSSPVVVGRRAFLGTTAGEVVALDLESGEPVWRFETGSAIVASPSVAQGKLVIGSLDGVLYCFG
jgi:outer membrane protein assembly factor BamB